jgi:CO dehydrogenase/acetyl-CoA synthase delta subunit
MKARRIPTEAERLKKYFRQLAYQIPEPTRKELEQVLSRPCKWAKILEERKKQVT